MRNVRESGEGLRGAAYPRQDLNRWLEFIDDHQKKRSSYIRRCQTPFSTLHRGSNVLMDGGRLRLCVLYIKAFGNYVIVLPFLDHSCCENYVPTCTQGEPIGRGENRRAFALCPGHRRLGPLCRRWVLDWHRTHAASRGLPALAASSALFRRGNAVT